MLTLLTLCVGLGGAGIGWFMSMPAAFLIGPALAVSLAGLAGLSMGITGGLRNLVMVALGLGIGAGFDASASAAILRWPLAFVVQGLTLVLALYLGRWMLNRWFGFDRKSAVLAVVPGHLSLVIAMASEAGMDTQRVILVQSLRLLSLIVLVPFAALMLGYEMQAGVLPGGVPMLWGHLAGLALVGVGAAWGFARAGIPAPLLLGPMVVSAVGHISGLTPGTVPDWIMSLAFVGMGAMLGTRFSGLSVATLRSGLLAGLASAGLAVILTVLSALPVAMMLNMPAAHVLAAFSPGGLETMIALGVAMGASPGFVAACHIMRLLVLGALLPLFLRSASGKTRSSSP
ncbi:MAG: AbrB family transcriptional regulator [Rhodobacteraceae bacterium]|nr:AbrB family transcriptional regulator [Paracoccaceae bacterium]